MSKTTYEVRRRGLGFPGALTILFIALKLTGVIDWAWVWVLSPLWIGIVATAVIVLIGFLVFIVYGLYDERRKDKRLQQARTRSSLRR